jgi:hypothetical protein
MDTEQQRGEEQPETAPADDESVEDFREEIESDPSRAPSDDENVERIRGG